MTHGKVVSSVSSPSLATTFTMYGLPDEAPAVTVPEISPVAGSIARPVGRFVAV